MILGTSSNKHASSDCFMEGGRGRIINDLNGYTNQMLGLYYSKPLTMITKFLGEKLMIVLKVFIF